MKSKITSAIPVIFLAFGLLYFLEPVLSAWLEIVNPVIARTVFLPLDWISFILTLPLAMTVASIIPGDTGYFHAANSRDYLFLVVFLFYLTYYVRVVRFEPADTQKRFAATPLIIFPLLFVLMIPLGFTTVDRRVNSYPVGGKSLLMMAGGATTVRDEAIQLMNSSTAKEPSWSELPPALQKIRGFVVIEHDRKTVVLGLGRAYSLADEFGFIFQTDNDAKPNSLYLERFDFHRYWKLADGVYFYEVD